MKLVAAGLLIAAAVSVQAKSIYHIGNSWTDCSYGVHDIAQGFDISTVFGRHMIPGAPLEWIWNHPDQGGREPSGYPTALPQGWDVVVLQPWDRNLANDQDYAERFSRLAFAGNPDAMILILVTERSSITGHFNPLVDHLRNAFPGKLIGQVPYGNALEKCQQIINNGGTIGPVTDMSQFYIPGDGHPNNYGMYVMATALFAAAFQSDPTGAVTSGLRFWRAPYSVEQSFAEEIWKIVWDITSTSNYCNFGTTSTSHYPMVRAAGVTAYNQELPVNYSLLGRNFPSVSRVPAVLVSGSRQKIISVRLNQ